MSAKSMNEFGITNSEQSLGNVSIPSVKQYLQLAQERQLATDDLLSRLAINSGLLNDNGAFISGDKFQALIAELVELSSDDLFGLHTAKFVQPFSYSVLGYITMNCETLGQAIEKIQPYEKLVGDMGTTQLEQESTDFKISWHCQYPDPRVRRHMTDNCLASWFTFARYLTNTELSPKQVLLSRQQPSESQHQEYQSLFGCNVEYEQAQDAIVFSAELLSLPLDKGDQQLLPVLESHAETIMTQLSAESDLITQVKFHIEQHLPTGKFRQPDIAQALGMGYKTMQRKLKEQDTSFQVLLDEVRFALTEQALQQEKMDVEQLSVQLGFTETRSFFRWFKKLTNQTPGEYKNQ